MKSINNSVEESSELKSPVSENESQANTEKINFKRKNSTLVLVLLFILILLIGLIIYLYLTDKTEVPPVDNEENTEEEKEDSDEKEDSEEKEDSGEGEGVQIPIRSFVYKDSRLTVGFTLEYPQNWEVIKNESFCYIDSLTNTEICDGHDVVLSLIGDSQYYIDLKVCLGCNSRFVCTYPDSNITQNNTDGIDSVMFNTFEEFGNGKFRRGLRPSNLDTVQGDWVICKRSDTENSSVFSSSCGVKIISAVTYGVSKSTDKEILKVMDNIILSLKEVSLPEDNQHSHFRYEYEVEAVEYEPDSNYVGFKICNNAFSTCTIFGIKASEIAKATLGERFILRFNEIGNTGAAAGTAYIEVAGDFELIPIK